MIPQGQITLESKFGKALTELARAADTIVEVGTWFGQGSTLCLFLGICQSRRPEQRLYTIECDPEKVKAAKDYYKDESNLHQIKFLCGVVTREMDPMTSNSKEDFGHYEAERVYAQGCPVILDQIPDKIDLLLLDGGEWSSGRVFDLLISRTKIVALDDCNGKKAFKNARNREKLLYDRKLGKWYQVEEDLKDRNGWSIFKRLNDA